ncbi:MAG: hypothetical protein HY695_37475 [Deltaproteobacteria bacterium]|nr:hypothetical protein [Deltaproteobacteria bacterium]
MEAELAALFFFIVPVALLLWVISRLDNPHHIDLHPNKIYDYKFWFSGRRVG